MKNCLTKFLYEKGVVFFVSFVTSILFCSGLYAQAGNPYSVTGKVSDEDGRPISGATVVIDGTTIGATTSAKGEFKLNIPASESGKELQLRVNFIGYNAYLGKLSQAAHLDIALHEKSEDIDDVVVIGYGTARKADLTTAISVVSTDDIDKRPITSASSAIQGKAAGVQVLQPSGQPGSGMVIRIRGASSIASSNDPLYVVDGVPVGEGEYAISYLSPNEIESIQILKDASSAAIYGSRGANGVVLITTKSGSSKEHKISFSSFIGVSKAKKTYNVLNAQEYLELMRETNNATPPDDIKDETDWFKEAFSTGVNQNYQLSYSGGNEKNSYYVGGGYSKEKGVLDVAFSERYNFSANIENRVRSWIKFNTNIHYARYKTNGLHGQQSSTRDGVVISVITTPTYAKVWDPEKPNQYWSNFYGADLTTPAESMGRTRYNFEQTDRLIGTIGATLQILKNLSFKSSVSMDRRWVRKYTFLDPIATSYGRTQKGEAKDTRSDDLRMIYDNILNYNLTFGEHKIDLMGGTSATTSRWEDLWGERSHFSNEYGNAIKGIDGGNKGGLRGQGAGVSEWNIMSYLARATYNYKGKYLFTANFRADGSSKLAPNHRWGYFPSFSGAWRISGENFMSNVSWINDLKLRAGWGQTGNQAGLSSYAYLQRYKTIYYDWTIPENADKTPSLGDKDNIKNESLKWETTTQTNVGIDFTVLNNRLTFTIDAYYKYTKDMLMEVPLPAPNPSMYRNEGEMSNKGFEFSIHSRNFTSPTFRWNTDFNISVNRNKLEKLSYQQVYYYAQTYPKQEDKVIRMTPGQPLSKFWGYVSDGVDPETGNIIYRDLDGNGEINAMDKKYIGNANPKFTFGMTNDFYYKGFSLNVLITGSYGNDIYNASKMEMVDMVTGANQLKEVKRRWKIPGQITDVPRAGNVDNSRISSRFIENGSYLKVKNITLSYDFNFTGMRKLNISRIQPYISLQNFITWTKYSGYDPEVSQYDKAYQMGIDWGTYPNIRTVVFGINFDF